MLGGLSGTGMPYVTGLLEQVRRGYTKLLVMVLHLLYTMNVVLSSTPSFNR
jgi:hypothetical protein